MIGEDVQNPTVDQLACLARRERIFSHQLPSQDRHVLLRCRRWHGRSGCLAGGASPTRLIASALALVHLDRCGRRLAAFPAMLAVPAVPSHVTPIKADKTRRTRNDNHRSSCCSKRGRSRGCHGRDTYQDESPSPAQVDAERISRACFVAVLVGVISGHGLFYRLATIFVR